MEEEKRERNEKYGEEEEGKKGEGKSRKKKEWRMRGVRKQERGRREGEGRWEHRGVGHAWAVAWR